MIKTIHIIAYLLLATALPTPAAFAQSGQASLYTRIEQLGAVRFTYDDLLSIVDSALSLAERANSGLSATEYTSRLRLEGSGRVTEVEGVISADGIAGSPDVSSRVDYTYYLRGGRISDIGLSLNDYSRDITVSGSDQSQVDAIALSLRDKLSAHVTAFSGPNVRMIGFMLLVFSPWIIVALALSVAKTNFIQYGALAIAAICLFAPFLLPWGSWLAGTAITRGSASPVVYYAAEISFFGVMFAIVSPLAAIAFDTWRRKQVVHAPTSETVDSEN